MCRRVVIVLAGLALTACATPTARPAAALPEGAVPLTDGIYMTPLGEDRDGCMQYQAHASGKLTTQVIQYRKTDGSFTMLKSEADCDRY